MANEIFIDTSGFFAMMASDDDRHVVAARLVAAAGKRKRGFVTTDYVLDETSTLLQARRKTDRKSTRLNSSHIQKSRMPSSA